MREHVNRAVTRVASVGVTGLTTVLLTAGPALAADYPIGPSEGEDRGEGIGTVELLLLYVGIPLLAALLIFSVVWLPGAVRSHRYRPTKGWHAAPVWFAGPPEPVAAVQSAEPGDVVRGGASGSW